MENNVLTQEELENISNMINKDIPTFDASQYRPKEKESGEYAVVNVGINPETGENQITDTTPLEVTNFEDDVSDKINHFDLDISAIDDVSYEEFTEVILKDNSMLEELGENASVEDTKEVIKIINARIKDPTIDVYKLLPKTIQEAIDSYVGADLVGYSRNAHNMGRRRIANNMIDSYIHEIRMSRSRLDFAHQLAHVYKEATNDIEESHLDSIDERQKVYRDITNKLDDSDKKERMNRILDYIDEAKSLNKLKEFAKTCKIKRYELERPGKTVYNKFLNKYKNSINNIYDIDIARKSLGRHINKDATDNYDISDIDRFFIIFCKYVKNYKDTVPEEHAFMYYVLYYCILTDTEKSETFLENVREVIRNNKR